ncbi:hypothetical protein [Litchfieldia alkalitelluris]|uniref:hypothetical protein n=1 Tax=Litchfieldia alkalitelluris TaxID=304268 RepID=UPI0009963773|nr:hypothetical protein [Litchfieldia alkalitelluris]
MRNYLIILIQLLIWCIYSIVEWVSKSDGIKSKGILLLIFCYFAFLAASKIGLSKRHAALITFFTLSGFFICQHLFWSYLLEI